MKSFKPVILLLLSALLFLPGCGIIAGIFQAGFWTAIILIVAVVALIIWGISSYSSSSSDTHNSQDI